MKTIKQIRHERRLKSGRLKNGTTRPYFHDDNIKYTSRNTYAVNNYGGGITSINRII